MKNAASIALALLLSLESSGVALAQQRGGGGGGGRPAGGGGGGARPAAAPARPQQPASRPQQPASRPQQPASRPQQPASRPQQPASRPQQNVTKPQNGFQLNNDTKAPPRPNAPSGNRPSGGGNTVNKPNNGGNTVNRPNNGGNTVNKPNNGGNTINKPNNGGNTNISRPGGNNVNSGNTNININNNGNIARAPGYRPANNYTGYRSPAYVGRPVIVNPIYAPGPAWGWNHGSPWYPAPNYWGGGFWGSLAITAAGAATAAAVYGSIVSNNHTYTSYQVQPQSPGSILLSNYKLQQVQCGPPNLVVMYGPNNSVICANPNDNVPPGAYDIDPASFTLVPQ
jgi:hypothetical protein